MQEAPFYLLSLVESEPFLVHFNVMKLLLRFKSSLVTPQKSCLSRQLAIIDVLAISLSALLLQT